MADEKRGTVCAMPGGNTSYIKTLHKTWDWLNEQSRTIADFYDWFAECGWKKRSGTNQTLPFLIAIGLIVKNGDDRLQAPRSGTFSSDESIIRALHEKCLFIGDLLKEVASPKTKEDLQLAAKQKAGFTMGNTHAVTYRRGWLESAGMLEFREHKVHITEKGKEFLSSLPNEVGPPQSTTLHHPRRKYLNPKPSPQTPRFTLNTILYGPPGTGKTFETFQRCVDICDGEASRSGDEVQARYQQLLEEGRIKFVTFHQSYGYEEFVEGLRPDANSGGQLRLHATNGVIKEVADAARGKEQPYVLVIDEINRANISKVLGELITLLEPDKREGAAHEVAVTLPHSKKPFTLPANLYILGTMNTADRSIALLDTALRRRFKFTELVPKPKLLKPPVAGIDLEAVLGTINRRLEYLIDRDHLIGHAWLMGAETKAQIDDIMRHQIIPLIAEYFYDDWQKVRAVLGDNDGFVRREPIDAPPGLEDEDVNEKRYRWTVQAEFKDAAYSRLVVGSGGSDSTD